MLRRIEAVFQLPELPHGRREEETGGSLCLTSILNRCEDTHIQVHHSQVTGPPTPTFHGLVLLSSKMMYTPCTYFSRVDTVDTFDPII